VRMEDSNAFFFVFLPFPTHFLSHLLLPPSLCLYMVVFGAT
jgi:hypothetical protein